MTEAELKFANRLFWQVKGHLIPLTWSVSEIRKIEKSYFERLWGNHEAEIHLVGFEDAWKARMKSN